jgi:hypothetical protein
MQLLRTASVGLLCLLLYAAAQAGVFSTSHGDLVSAAPPPPLPTTILAYCRPALFGTCAAVAAAPGNTTLNANREFTVVSKINQSQLGPFSQTVGKTQIALNNPSSGTTNISNIFIGYGNTTSTPACATGVVSACAFNFDAPPTRATCNGANNFTLTPTSTGASLCGGTDNTSGITFLDAVPFIVSTSQPFMVAYDLVGGTFNVTTAPAVSPVNTFKPSTAAGNWNGYNAQTERLPASTAYNSGTGILTLTYLSGSSPFGTGVGSAYNGKTMILGGWTPAGFNGTWTITGTSNGGLNVLVGTHTGLAAITVVGTAKLQQAGLQLKSTQYTVQTTPVLNLLNRVVVQ